VRSGFKVRAKLLDLRRLDSAAKHVRVAVIVAKFSFSAAQRNKLKRRLRELVRLHMLPVLAPMDLLVRARREAYEATFELLRDDIAAAATQLAASAKNAPGDQGSR
jgi:ribonuclease P protein component